MLQLVYVSTQRGPVDLPAILARSRRNNARDGITGLLFADGTRFVQVLEGPAGAVRAAYERIRRDERHRAPVILSEREIGAREFGAWEMAHRAPGADGTAFLAQVAPMLAATTPAVRATFEGLMRIDRGRVRLVSA